MSEETPEKTPTPVPYPKKRSAAEKFAMRLWAFAKNGVDPTAYDRLDNQLFMEKLQLEGEKTGVFHPPASSTKEGRRGLNMQEAARTPEQEAARFQTGALGEPIAIFDRGVGYRKVSFDGANYFDVAGGQYVLVDTYSEIAGWFAENKENYLVNGDPTVNPYAGGLELGGVENSLWARVDENGKIITRAPRISFAIYPFKEIPPENRYQVLNPLVSVAKVLIGDVGKLAKGFADMANIPHPEDPEAIKQAAENVQKGVEYVSQALEDKEWAEGMELLPEYEGGDKLFAVAFFPIGKAWGPPGHQDVTMDCAEYQLECESNGQPKTVGVYALGVGEAWEQIRPLLNSVASGRSPR